jgi:hypothetical protein
MQFFVLCIGILQIKVRNKQQTDYALWSKQQACGGGSSIFLFKFFANKAVCVNQDG